MTDRPYLTPDGRGGLYWGDLIQAVLVRRYKRFLADVTLPDGKTVTAHTANTGAMLGCCEPGRPVWLSRHDNPSRKYPLSLEMIAMPSALVGVNTAVPNRLVREAARAGAIPELGRPAEVRSEVRRGDSRLDLLAVYPDRPDTYIEVKNCTLVEGGTALFPDAVTNRGAKHLDELAVLAAAGYRAILFVLVQRADAVRFGPADHIDPEWGRRLRLAVARGVKLLAYRADLTPERIRIGTPLPPAL